MVSQHLILAFCLAQVSTAIRFQGRGSANHTSASYSNRTTKAASSIYASVAASRTLITTPSSDYNDYASGIALSTGHVELTSIDGVLGPVDPSPQNATGMRNASCTVNILDASIEWWFPATYSHPLATITATWGNYSNANSLTLVPQTTSFDASSALQYQDVCTSGWFTYTDWDFTAYDCFPYTVKPTAASTAVVYRSAVPPIPTPAEINKDEIWTYDLPLWDLPSMTTTVSVAANSTAVETMSTPFVHFTAYEIERDNRTETVQLNSVYVQSYWQKDIEYGARATGVIPDGFMDHISQSACDAGVLQAVVTVIIFVELYYMNRPDFRPGFVHWESSALGWEDEGDSLGVMGQPRTSVELLIMTDWDLLGKTESIEPKTTEGRKPSPTLRPATDASPSKKTQAPQSMTVGTVGAAPVVVGPSSVVVIGTRTLRPGGPAVTVEGTPVALAPSATAIVVGGTSLPLPQHVQPGQQQTVGTFGTIPVVVGPLSVVVVGTQTLQPGGPPITIGPGTVVSLASSGTALVVGGTTSALPQLFSPAPQAAPPVLTIGSTTLVPNAATQFFIGPGQTLTPGGTAFIDGIKVSLDTSAAFVVAGSSTQVLPTSGAALGQNTNAQPELAIGGMTFTALPTNSRPDTSPGVLNRPQLHNTNNQDEPGPTFIISGQTLAPGGPPITVSGSTLSLASSVIFLVVHGSTTVLTTLAAVGAAHTTPLPLTIGNGVFKPLPGTGTTYQIGTAQLTPGGSIVVAGTTISLAAGATVLVVNGVTTTLATKAQPITTNPPLLTIGSQTYAAVPGTGTTFVIGGQTLTPGGTITVDGTTVLLSPQATELVYGSSGRSTSTALFPATTTRGSTVTSTAGASVGQSGGEQAAPTSSRQGAAPTVRLPLNTLLGVVGFTAWLLV